MSWSIDQQIDEVQFHINSLRSIILANAMETRPCLEIQRTLGFAMSVLRERREALINEKNSIANSTLYKHSATE